MTTIEEALRECLAGRTEWDEKPELYIMLERDGDVRLEAVPLPGFVWELFEPGSVLEGMGQAAMANVGVEALINKDDPDNVIGVAFRTEAWMLVAPVDDAVAAMEAELAGHERRIHSHPDRVEIRSVWGATQPGMWHGMQVKGEDEIKLDMEDGALEGRIPLALNRMLFVFLAVFRA